MGKDVLIAAVLSASLLVLILVDHFLTRRRFDKHSQRFDKHSGRAERHSQRLDKVESRVLGIDAQLKKIQAQLRENLHVVGQTPGSDRACPKRPAASAASVRG
jgi:hypothetical protein